jgi:putative tryptophan/tyrosine transport system substrate-binding protein
VIIVKTIGILDSTSTKLRAKEWDAFQSGLKEGGSTVGKDVEIVHLAADNDYHKLPELAASLVGRGVDVIVAAGGPVTALAARAATTTIPIVFTTVADPVKSKLINTFAKPEGNATGTAGLTSELDARRLELLHQLVTTADIIGVLVNPNRPDVAAQSKVLQDAAAGMGLQLVFQNAATEGDIDVALGTLARKRVAALLVTADASFYGWREHVVALAARHALPAVYQWREFVVAGGLMSYGPILSDAYRQAGAYTARIVKGDKTADLPVVQPKRFEMVINLKAAQALDLGIPPSLRARADEVIE